VLDGDNVRHGLCKDLGFSHEDRTENIRRVAEVANLMNDAGLIVITSFISPFRQDREQARQIIGEERFREIHLSTDLSVCEERDPKGLYKKARAGKLPDFTGIGSPYEEPLQPFESIDTDHLSLEESVARLMKLLQLQPIER
jgi:adenylylsulfate kinase